MTVLEKVRQLLSGRRSRRPRRFGPRRRRPGDRETLPGGDSAEDAAKATPERAGELAD